MTFLRKILALLAASRRPKQPPYIEGYNARLRIFFGKSNPYEPGSFHAQQWQNGYDAAMIETAW